MFLAWLLHASRLDRPRLPVLLTLHGKHAAPGTHARRTGPATPTAGRCGSATAPPTSISSTAYGWVLDAAWLLSRGRPRL